MTPTPEREDVVAALAEARAEIARLADALLAERIDVLWNAYYAGIERDGKWMNAAMSDAEWLLDECGFGGTRGWHDAETIKAAIPQAAAKFVAALRDAREGR